MRNKFIPVILCLVVFCLSYVLSSFLYGNTNTDLINTMLGVSSFIFGIFFAYYLGISSTKFTKITESLRKDDKSILGIFYNSKVLNKEDHEKITSLIDDYLVNQADYYLKDYPKTSEKFFRLFEYCQAINVAGFKEENAYEGMQDLLKESLENRKVVESQLSYRISFLEWFSLIIFAATILVCMYILSSGSIIASLLISTISMGIVVILYLLYDLDSLQWKSSKLIWIPLTKLFTDMGLLPYYPKSVFKRINLRSKNGQVRLVEYPRKYPDFQDKKVDIVSSQES